MGTRVFNESKWTELVGIHSFHLWKLFERGKGKGIVLHWSADNLVKAKDHHDRTVINYIFS